MTDMERKRTEYTLASDRIPETLRLAVAPDIHSADWTDVLDDFARCDAVLIPGDLVDRHRRDNRNAERFLREVPEIVPVFYSLGNHEVKYRHREAFLKMIGDRDDTILKQLSTVGSEE